jgi:hypothetical protein
MANRTQTVFGPLKKKTLGGDHETTVHNNLTKVNSFPLTEGQTYNLRRYNRRRHELLVKLPAPVKSGNEKEIPLSDRINDAMRIDLHCCTGNVNISLFWEDLFFIITRIAQMYAFFFFTFYEYWP